MDHEEDRRQIQIGLNEASYRRVNEGIAQGETGAADLVVLCECGRLGCNQLIDVTRESYEGVRANPRRFMIVPGHELPEAERVVEQTAGYTVVEKHEAAGEIAEMTDPRPPLE